ncbi:MAG: response regulator [Armatimonadota bacterium]
MRHTVLVIDDQWSMQELARIILRTAGYRVLLASDGATGLSLARIEHPDVIVLDQHMPDMDGMAVLHSLRQDPKTAVIPVVFIATEPQLTAMPIDAQAGSASCLQKPFPPPALLLMVDRMINRDEMPVAV